MAFWERQQHRRIIYAPREFTIDNPEGRGELVQFLEDLRKAVLVDEDPHTWIDFSATTTMRPAGTLLFAAELARIKHLSGVRFSGSFPRDDVVAQVLQHVGIFDMLGQRRRCEVKATNVRTWQVDSGSEVLGQRAGDAMKRYAHLFSDPDQKLYAAITEAMTNCRQHAYEGERGDGFPNVRNWWMFSQYMKGKLTVAFCDLGIGIPRSLPSRTPLWKRVKRLITFSGWQDDDGHRIQAAMVVGASRTKKTNRGKGLVDMRSVVDGLNAQMQIHSNCGKYVFNAETKKETCSTFDNDHSIRGTIVLWTLPVRK